jgi:arabinofuranosyltransferase
VRPRRVLPDLVAMFALPVAYQVFRMGYFAAIVPNTAIAKDADGVHLDEGWRYLSDFVGPYRLWLPVALIAVVVWRGLRAQADRRMTTAVLAMVAAAGLGGAYIVAIGGDYMLGRLLLPAFFALALPASVVVRGRDLPAVALGALATVWALVGVVWFRPPAPEAPMGFLPPTIADWRTLSGARMFPEDFALGLNGGEARELYDEGVRGYFRADSEAGRAGHDPDQLVVVLGAIGVPGHRAGPDVWVVDLSGLAEPVAARSEPLLGRPAGHRKLIDTAWYDARFGGSTGDGDVIAARHALSCEPIDDMLDAISEPLTVGRFLSNVWHSVDYTRLTIPSDPHEAEALLCRPADDR